MAYDEILAERTRDQLADQADLEEKKMFGGIAFLIRGNMAVGVSGNSLMVRVGPDIYDAALAEPGIAPFDMTGRPMKGWVLASPDAVAGDKGLAHWVRRGVEFAATLPPK